MIAMENELSSYGLQVPGRSMWSLSLWNTVFLKGWLKDEILLFPFIWAWIGCIINQFVLVESILFDVVHDRAGKQVSDGQAPPHEKANL